MNEKIPIDMMERHLSTFPKLESLMKDSICEIYNKDKQKPLGYGLGWALNDSIKSPKGSGTKYLESLELNLCSIVGKIDEEHLTIFKKRLIGNFWETFPEIQVLGAIYRAEKEVEIEKCLPDMDLERPLDFFILQPQVFIEVYQPYSIEFHDEYEETPTWADLKELVKIIYKKFKQKRLINNISRYPVFLIINTTHVTDDGSILVSEIKNELENIFRCVVNCKGILLYNNIDINRSYLLWNQNCSEELKEELTKIFNELNNYRLKSGDNT